MSSASLLAQLQAEAQSGERARVEALFVHYAPQLLQLEQQRATAPESLDEPTRQLAEWVASYATTHEDPASPHAPAASSSPSPSVAPAPLFFYLLQRDTPLRSLPLLFLSSLYTDPQRDQEFHWLSDAWAMAQQTQQKIRALQKENREMAERYATQKQLAASAVARHLLLYSGICEVLQTLLNTRARALTAHLAEVRSMLAESHRERIRAGWQHWMASSDTEQGNSNLLALEEALAASGERAWHPSVAAQRRHKTSLHARAFRSFLHPADQPLQQDLAPLLVDKEFSEEGELLVDRLWSLATNSFQHQGHGDEAAQQAQVSWSYPPPSVHALLDVFLLEDASPDVPGVHGAAAPPPSYRVWLIYYLLLDFEQRRQPPSDPSAPLLSVEFALTSGLTVQQQQLIAGMVHLDAAYAPAAHSGRKSASEPLSPERSASFLSALACFSLSFESLLSQPDFPLVSSLLASVLALQQWAAGVTFFQNCYLANSAAATESAAAVALQLQMARLRATRKLPPVHEPIASVQPQQIFYSTLHHVLYVHILMQQGLNYDAVQFIRGQSDLDAATSMSLHTPLQVILWRYWNTFLLQRRQYDVLLKQISFTPLEERLVVGFWKQMLKASPPSNVAAVAAAAAAAASTAASSKGPTLTPADLVILYAFEHNDIERGLRFHASFQRQQSNKHAAQRVELRLPEKILQAYAKLVHFDTKAADAAEDDDADADELDAGSIQLREVERSVAALQLSNRPLLHQILSAHAADAMADDDDMDASVEMVDAQRVGAELNPFSSVNEQRRTEAARSAAAAAAQPVPVPVASAPVAHASPSAAAAPAEAKSPEKTPRVQRLPASQSAAKAKRAQAAKEEAEARLKQQQEQEQEQVEESDEQAEEAEEAMDEKSEAAAEDATSDRFSSFASPAPKRTQSAFSSVGAVSQSPPAVLLSSASKPQAFSDMPEGEVRDNSAFLLPLPDTQAAASSSSSSAAAAAATSTSRGHSAAQSDGAAAVRPTPKRSARLLKSDSVERSMPDAAAASPAPALAPFERVSSHFTPSLLAPSALTATQRIRSSRKRPLLSQPPVFVPPVPVSSPMAPRHPSPTLMLTAGESEGAQGRITRSSSQVSATPARRSTRASVSRMDDNESAAASDDGGDGNASVSTAEDELTQRHSRRTSPVTKPSSRARASTRRTPVDAHMDDVSAPPSVARSSSRRAAAASPAPISEPNPFQRGALPNIAAAGRRSRTAPIFIDESLLDMSGVGEAQEDDVADDQSDVSSVRRSTRRGASSRASAATSLARASPSPTPSTSTSPSRPVRAAAIRASHLISATIASPAPGAGRSRSRASGAVTAAADNVEEAPSSRRSTRHVQADVEAPTTRTTRRQAAAK